MRDEVNRFMKLLQKPQQKRRQEFQSRQQHTVVSSTPIPTYSIQQRVIALRELSEKAFGNLNSISKSKSTK